MMLRAALDRELSEVEQALVQMHHAVDQALTQALRAFDHRYCRSAQALISGDSLINERRAAVEEAVLFVIARRQPQKRDLRLCIAAIAIAADLERIGDYAAGVAKLALREPGTYAPVPELQTLAREVREFLALSIGALINHDATLAAQLFVADDRIDDLYAELRRRFVTLMAGEPAAFQHHLFSLFVAHNLERIADRAVHIAERTAWVVTGQRRKS